VLNPEEKYSKKERFLFSLTGLLGPYLIKLIGFFCNNRVEGEEILESCTAQGKGVIIALWHGRMLIPIYYLRHRDYVSLVSLHRDGEFITRIVRKLGYTIHRGSPKEGGLEGFRKMLKDLKNGRIVSIFPDGPTGPRHSIHSGVLHLARLSGSPIVPMLYSAKSCWCAKSWDRFMVPFPFSKTLIKFEKPTFISRHADLELESQKLSNRMIRIENEMDEKMGVVLD